MLGYCTDTGKTTHLMQQRLSACNALILEFNHNLQLLKNGPYPPALQQRLHQIHIHLIAHDYFGGSQSLPRPHGQVSFASRP